MKDLNYILSKYGDIIKEEVNVKELKPLSSDIKITKIYVPDWKKIASKFWKDTWKIIKFAKQGNVEELEDWKIKVYWDEWESWILEKDEYNIRYQGIDEKNMAVEEWIVVRLDTTIDEDLKKEWIIREVSRFLNQLRKEAGYNVDDRVDVYYNTNSEFLKEVINDFNDWLKNEVLAKDMKFDDNLSENSDWYDIVQVFNSENWKVIFGLKRWWE